MRNKEIECDDNGKKGKGRLKDVNGVNYNNGETKRGKWEERGQDEETKEWKQ